MTATTNDHAKLWELIKDTRFGMLTHRLAEGAKNDAVLGQSILKSGFHRNDVNNGIYGTIRAHQERHYPARISGTTMINPDFSALARAYGFHAERVDRTEDFPAAFARARASRTGAVLELTISAEALTPRQTLSQMRDAALAAKEKQ